MRSLGFVIAIGCTLPLASASTQEPAQITLERGPCFLRGCRPYTVELWPTGRLQVLHRVERGQQVVLTDTVSPAAVTALVNLFTRVRFFDLDSAYTPGQPGCGLSATDGRTAWLTLRVGGRSKTIEHYTSCIGPTVPRTVDESRELFHRPPGALGVLTRLEYAVDSVAGIRDPSTGRR